MRLLYALFEAWWRRCFGDNGHDLPILKYRAVQHVIGFTATSLCLCYYDCHWIIAGIAAGVLQGLYWARAVGPGIDAGSSTDMSMIVRYEKEFWDKWCKFLLPKKVWYSYYYDFLWMLFRYHVYAIVLSVLLLNPLFLLAPWWVAFAYTLGRALEEKKKVRSGSAFAEYASGFVTGLLLP